MPPVILALVIATCVNGTVAVIAIAYVLRASFPEVAPMTLRGCAVSRTRKDDVALFCSTDRGSVVLVASPFVASTLGTQLSSTAKEGR